jgi:hypothetical protein
MNAHSQAVGAYQRGDFPATRTKLEKFATLNPAHAERLSIMTVKAWAN